MARKSASSESQGVIALDLGGTKLASGLFAPDGRILTKDVVALERRAGPAVGELIVERVRKLMEIAPGVDLSVSAVGISVPGIASAKSGRVWAPNIPARDDYPIASEIKDAIDAPIEVVVESDRAASIRGEAWQGAARGCRDAVFMAVGTGIGAGILMDGRVIQGAHGIAGSIGWLALERPYRADYVECGCFESHASGEGLAKVATSVLARHRSYRGPLRTMGQPTAHDLFEAYERDDEIAAEVFSQAIEFWGMASANLVSLLNPEILVFGGGVFGPATRFLEAIATEARRWAQPIAIERVRFEASQLGSDAALYGAGNLALRESC